MLFKILVFIFHAMQLYDVLYNSFFVDLCDYEIEIFRNKLAANNVMYSSKR